jgi:O-antigen/teichoic acid export membrane protein
MALAKIIIIFPHHSIAIFFMLAFSCFLSALRTGSHFSLFYGIASTIFGIVDLIVIKAAEMGWRLAYDDDKYIIAFLCLIIIAFYLALCALLRRWLNADDIKSIEKFRGVVYFLRFGWFFCASTLALMIYGKLE